MSVNNQWTYYEQPQPNNTHNRQPPQQAPANPTPLPPQPARYNTNSSMSSSTFGSLTRTRQSQFCGVYPLQTM